MQETNHMRTCMGALHGPYIRPFHEHHKIHHNNHYIFHLLFDNIVLSFVLSTLIASSSSAMAATGPKDTSSAVLIRVDQSGQGDYKKIQDAINSVPSNNSEFVYIWVKPGTYR